MGMSIDDHIEILKSYHNGFTGQAGNLQESIDVAVCIMHKYQKIEDLWNRCHTFDHDKHFQMIGQIIEKGDIQIY